MTPSFLEIYQSLLDKVLSSQNDASPSHAMLFYGDPDRGTRLFAMHLCREMLQLKEDSPDFQWIQHASHPQVRLLESSDAIIPIETVRQSLHSFQQAANGELNFLIIHGVHKLKTESVNALLKTLEEPPRNSFILCTSPQKDRLLATLLSRLVHFEFPAIPKSAIRPEDHALWDWCQGAWLCMQTESQESFQEIAPLNWTKKASLKDFLDKKWPTLESSETLLLDLENLAKMLFIKRKESPVLLQKMTEAVEYAILEKSQNVSSKIVLRSLQLRLFSILNSSL